MACRTLREPGLVDAMHDLLRHGLGRSVEDGRLIHVIPKTRNAHLRKVPEKRAPPGASLCASKIRKDTGTRPYHARVNAAIRILYEVVTGNASVVGRIAVSRKVCDMQIRNRDHMKIFRGELCDHPGKVREAIAVHSKRAVLLLEINVQIDCIRGNVICPEPVSYFDHSRLRSIAIPGLLVAETPDRGKLCCPS